MGFFDSISGLFGGGDSTPTSGKQGSFLDDIFGSQFGQQAISSIANVGLGYLNKPKTPDQGDALAQYKAKQQADLANMEQQILLKQKYGLLGGGGGGGGGGGVPPVTAQDRANLAMQIGQARQGSLSEWAKAIQGIYR